MLRTRPFKLTDTPNVLDLADALAAHHGERSSLTPEFLRHAIRQPELKIIVATEQTKPVGFVSLQRRISLTHARDFVHIDNISVLPEKQGRGVGRALVRAAADHAVQNNAQGLSLFFRVVNPGADAFYKQLGFIVTPHTEIDHRAELTGEGLQHLLHAQNKGAKQKHDHG